MGSQLSWIRGIQYSEVYMYSVLAFQVKSTVQALFPLPKPRAGWINQPRPLPQLRRGGGNSAPHLVLDPGSTSSTRDGGWGRRTALQGILPSSFTQHQEDPSWESSARQKGGFPHTSLPQPAQTEEGIWQGEPAPGIGREGKTCPPPFLLHG